MKNLKLIFVGLVLFAAFGFTIINTSEKEERSNKTEVASIEIESRFSDDVEAFN